MVQVKLCGNHYLKKKQGFVSLLITEADSISIGKCCAQILLIVHQLSNYDLAFKQVKIMFDYFSAICLSKKIVHNFRAKHIDIKHHFFRDHD